MIETLNEADIKNIAAEVVRTKRHYLRLGYIVLSDWGGDITLIHRTQSEKKVTINRYTGIAKEQS